METSYLKKLLVATPFQIKDVTGLVIAKDIQSLIGQNNYSNKYLQNLDHQNLANEQVGETSNKPSTSKLITKPLFKPYEFP